MTNEIEKLVLDTVIKIFDEYIISSGKRIITLRTANDLLSNQDYEVIKNINLKNLLETNQIPHAYQTDSKPRQWQIPLSPTLDFDTKRAEYLKANNLDKTTNFNQAPQTIIKMPLKDWLIFGTIIFVTLAIFGLAFIGNRLNKPETSSYNGATKEVHQSPPSAKDNSYNGATKELHQSPPTDKDNSLDLIELSGQKFTFKSTLNDKEYNGEIIQTNNETTYHTFDFINLTVTQKAALNGQWVTITYPMNGYYKESGLLASTYVIQVHDLGVTEIWFSPDVPNIGYDFMDGSRIACYDIVRIK
jgi:hypothetical protein